MGVGPQFFSASKQVIPFVILLLSLHRLDESLILYGRMGPSLPLSDPPQSLYPTSIFPYRSPSNSFSSDHLPHRSPKSRQQSHTSNANCKILSQILSLDSTIDESNPRLSGHKKYKYMKQNTFDSCMYTDTRDSGMVVPSWDSDGFRLGLNGNRVMGRSSFGEKGESSDSVETVDEGGRLGGSSELVQVSGLDKTHPVHERLEEIDGSVRKKNELEDGKARSRRESREIDNQNGSTNPNITINIIESNREPGENISSSNDKTQTIIQKDEISGLSRTVNSHLLDKAYSTIEESSEEDKSITRNKAGSLADNSISIDSNGKSKDCSICKNSYIISHISNNSGQVFSDTSHICGDNFSNTSSNILNYNVCDLSAKRSSVPCTFSSNLSNSNVSQIANSSPKNVPSNVPRNNFAGNTCFSSVSNNSPTNRPMYVSNDPTNISNKSSFNNDSDSSNLSNSPSKNRSSNKTSHTVNNSTFANISSNTLSVNNLKRFNKCKSIDTSIDEIKYDLVGVSFLNPAGASSRSNTNISTICNVTGASTSASNNRRKFSMGTNNAAGNEASPLADLSKPYNLYKCLNQGNKYLKRQYSIDKPGLSVGEAGASKENGNKSVVKIQIHRE